MYHRKWQYPLMFSVGLLLWVIAAIMMVMPTNTVKAQCGSQASSCLSCHEVQGEMSVNSDGTGWHESHAFGDFCYLCHAGNQQSSVVEEAHTGMVHPLSDTKAACQMCHAADLEERAQVYAVALNYDLSGGGEPAAEEVVAEEPVDEEVVAEEPADTEADTSAEVVAPVTANNEPSVDCIPAGGLVVDDAATGDFVARYNEIVLGEADVNWGNVILVVAIGAVVFFGIAFIIVNEIVSNTVKTVPVDGEYPEDVVEMLPALSSLKVQTRASLGRILTNPKKADKVLGVLGDVVDGSEEA